MRHFFASCLWFLGVTVMFFSCNKEEKVPEKYFPRNDFDAYRHAIEQLNLSSTALGKDWLKASQSVFEDQIDIKVPYQESFNLDASKPVANAYRFEVKRGQKVLIDIEQLSKDSAFLFIDVFRIIDDSLKEFHQIATADSALNVAFEARKDAEYILRLQPELLRGGKFNLTIEKVASLEFPVFGKNSRAILSKFGVPRDAGRRKHEGVDIFAKRHTPIVAPCKGYVRFVGERGIGGKVIWLYDSERRQSLYFAHLDSQYVKPYTYVNAGDTLGTVGNTGNARTTPPHLHFGIYSNGAIDPYYFIAEVNDKPKPVRLSPEILGNDYPVGNKSIVRSKLSSRSLAVDTLEINESVKVEAVTQNVVRVETKEGVWGYLNARNIKFESSLN